MPQAVTVYRWDDPGAPQMGTGNLWSGILNILKKCLVEGYGTKAAAGWTVEYEDVPGNKCVFRNDPVEGSGGYVQFQRQSDTVFWYKSALSMTGVDQYINDGYMCSINLPTGTTFNNAKWIIQATKTAFYFSLAASSETTYSNSSHFMTLFVGDIISYIKNDPASFLTVGFNNQSKTVASTTASISGAFNPIPLNQINVTSYSGSQGTNGTQINIPLTGDALPSTGVYVPLGPFNNPTVARTSITPNGPTLLDKFYISLASSLINGDANEPNIRGHLPGLLCSPVAFYYQAPYPQIINVNGNLHFGVSDFRNNTAAQGGIRRWINCEQWENLNRD